MNTTMNIVDEKKLEKTNTDITNKGTTNSSGVTSSNTPQNSSSKNSRPPSPSGTPPQIQIKRHAKKEKMNDIDDYYKKKGEYNKKLQDRKDKILEKNISKKEKREQFKKIKLPCIFCKRNVNSVFENKENHLIARCGSNDNPCENKIKINNNNYYLLTKIIQIMEELTEISKTKINRLKFQTLFSDLPREKSSEMFKKYLNEYNSNMSLYVTYLRKYNDLIEQKEKNEILSNSLLEFSEFLESMKISLQQFQETKQLIILSDSIDNMVKNVIPLIEKIRNLKYSHMEIINKNEKGDIGLTDVKYLETKIVPYELLEEEFEIKSNNINSDSESDSDNESLDN